MRIACTLLAVALVAGLSPAWSQQAPGRTLVARDLANPRGMVVLPGGDLVVAEAGTGDHDGEGRFSGRILRLHDEDGDGRWLAPVERRVLVDGQISYNGRSVFGTGRDEVGGLGDVALGPDGRVLFTKDDPFPGYLADGAQQDIAVSSVPSDGGRVQNVVEGMTTLNAVVWDPRRERYFVIESGANRLVSADLDGRRSPVATFASLEDGQQAVPSGLALDPRDGRLWVALFSGVLYDTPAPGQRRSFLAGASKVVHLDPGNGEVRVAFEGLTTAVDVEVGADGTVFVLEMTTEPPTPRLPDDYDLHDTDTPPLAGGYVRFTGRLTAHAPDGTRTVLASGLDAPSHLLLNGNVLYVATGQGTPGRPIPGPNGPTRIEGRIWRIPTGR